MSGLTPVTGSTGINVDTEFNAEFCGMTGLELNHFQLKNPDGSIVGGASAPNYDVTYGSNWARLIPHNSLTGGVTYTLEIDGRINDSGTVKAIDIGTWAVTTAGAPSIEGIEPYSGNARYWQFEGNPALLLGAFEGAHNVFLYPDQPNLSGNLTALMDEMVGAGGNVMRCVVDPGRAVNDGFPSPFTGTPGNYNLDFYTSGTNSFWGKFETLLVEAAARKIIVQIEFWSAHDWEDDLWDASPWNPSNNTNYTTGSSGLATSYSTRIDHPFGQTPPDHPDYNGAQADVIRGYQDSYIEHLLSISLQYDNVLYCANNETYEDHEWGAHWIGIINTEAAAAGKTVYSTDMFDHVAGGDAKFDIENNPGYDEVWADAATYTFVDPSQINGTRVTGGAEGHWGDLSYIHTQTSGSVRPINNTKVYGSDESVPSSFSLGSVTTRWGNRAAVNAFWMDVIGGCASVRFHRPTSGLGLDAKSKASLTAVRMLQTKVDLWDMAADFTHSLLTGRGTFTEGVPGYSFANEPFTYGEAFLSYEAGQQYAIYYTKGGSVDLDLTSYGGTIFDVDWIDIDAGEWGTSTTQAGGGTPTFAAPDSGAWAVAIALKPRTLPSKLYGVTMDAIDSLSDIVDALDSLVYMPTTRIVFDEWVDATDYTDAVEDIRGVSYIMGELLDSYYMDDYTVQQFKDRTDEYMDELGNRVDIWEIGNEVNGEWLGDPDDVVEKITYAYDEAVDRGLTTALTLYYNEDCWLYSWEEMLVWAAARLPTRMKSGLDYVLISYYEHDCNDLQPNWDDVFQDVVDMFPNSKVGISECGTTVQNDKQEYMERYYSMDIDQPAYVGGYFWWYGKQDIVPKSKDNWTLFNDTLIDNP